MRLVTGVQIKEASQDGGGKWFEFEGKDGEKFAIKVKFLSPKEKMELNQFSYNAKKEEMTWHPEYQKHIDIARRSILDWKGLTDVNGVDFPFNRDLLNDEVTMGALYNVELKEKGLLLPHLSTLVTDPLAFYQGTAG